MLEMTLNNDASCSVPYVHWSPWDQVGLEELHPETSGDPSAWSSWRNGSAKTLLVFSSVTGLVHVEVKKKDGPVS